MTGWSGSKSENVGWSINFKVSTGIRLQAMTLENTDHR